MNRFVISKSSFILILYVNCYLIIQFPIIFAYLIFNLKTKHQKFKHHFKNVGANKARITVHVSSKTTDLKVAKKFGLIFEIELDKNDPYPYIVLLNG